MIAKTGLYLEGSVQFETDREGAWVWNNNTTGKEQARRRKGAAPGGKSSEKREIEE